MRHTIRDVESRHTTGRVVSVMRGLIIVLSIWIDLSGEYPQVCCKWGCIERSCAEQQSLRAYIVDKYPNVVWGNFTQ
jgi:hypothetical protein